MPPNDLKNLGSQLKSFWGKLDKKLKFFLIGGSIGVTIALILLIFFLTRTQWGLLYRGLDEQTTGEIVEYLKSHKIPYKVAEDGSIYVPKDKVPEVRMEVASKGLIGGTGPGFELFDKEKLGLTEFQERVNYQRALEGELARTIKGIRGVKFVRVHLVLPKESVFISEEQPAKASVLITMKRGYTLTKEQVKGIVNLVSGAVPKLTPNNITIVDALTGKNLYYPGEEEENLPTSQLVFKRRLEYNLKNKIEELLGKALGYGRVIAQVSVDLSFDKEKILQETYDPEGTAVVSEELDQEKRYPVGKVPEGVAGVKGALAQKFEATGGTQIQGEVYTKTHTIKNYEVSKVVKNLEISPGQIKKISVAVLVDKDIIPAINTEKISWIEDLVKGAIGYNPERGDEVKVEAISFVKPKVPKPGIMDYIVKLYKPILALIVIVLFFLFVVRPILKNVLAPAPAPSEEVGGEVPAFEEEE